MLDGDYLRRCVAEFIGTFTLIFIGAGSVVFARTLTDIALANGLVIGVMVCAMGFTSGGLFNPAITLGFLITRRIAPPTRRLLLGRPVRRRRARGAPAQVGAPDRRSRTQSHLGVPSLGGGIGAGPGVVIEAVLTFFLVWVVFAHRRRPARHVQAGRRAWRSVSRSRSTS